MTQERIWWCIVYDRQEEKSWCAAPGHEKCGFVSFYEEDEPLEKIRAIWENAEKGTTGDCKDCAAPYSNPFETRSLRFLWWLDDSLHRRHVTNWFQRQLCNFVDRMRLRDV